MGKVYPWKGGTGSMAPWLHGQFIWLTVQRLGFVFGIGHRPLRVCSEKIYSVALLSCRQCGKRIKMHIKLSCPLSSLDAVIALSIGSSWDGPTRTAPHFRTEETCFLRCIESLFMQLRSHQETQFNFREHRCWTPEILDNEEAYSGSGLSRLLGIILQKYE